MHDVLPISILVQEFEFANPIVQKAATLNIFEWNKMQTYCASSWNEKSEIASIDNLKVRYAIQLLVIDMWFTLKV